MSRFVDQLRTILGRHFDIREETAGETVVSAWARMGLDLSAERGLTIHMQLPDEDAATELAFRADAIPGFERAHMAEIASADGLSTELTLTFRMKPEADAIDRLEQLVSAIGADLGAVADGWSADEEVTLPNVIAA